MNKKAAFLNSARVIFEETQSEKIKRNYRYLNLYVEGDPVSSHVALSTQIGWILANLALENNPIVKPQEVIELTLWHDTEETRIWDLGRDVRKYLKIDDQKALEEKFANVEWGQKITELKKRFEDKETDDINAKLAQDSDVLYVVLTIKKMVKSGVSIHKPEERIERTIKRLKTEEGKQLGEALKEVDPGEWWDVMMGYSKVNDEGKLEPA